MKTSRKLNKPNSSSKQQQLVLEEIIGLTTKNANGLASNIFSRNKCVYVAGCVAVVYDVDSGTQAHLMVSHRTPKPLTCVALSKDGRFVAAGEAGHQPAVLVWDCTTLAFVSELKGHLYGVECIAFSPDGGHLVSVGGYIYLWDWQSGLLITKLRASSSCSAVTSVSFSSDAKFIVTAGKKHLKFWMIGSSRRTRLNKGARSLAMHGKPVNLGPQKGSSFVSVTSAVCTNGGFVDSGQACEFLPIYALTDTGVLCLFHSGLSIRKSVDLKVEKGFALSVSDKLIACACSNGVVQLFTVETLEHAGRLLYSNVRNCHRKTGIICHVEDTERDFRPSPDLPDATACQFTVSKKLVVVYGDHSLYVWDIHGVNEATRCFALVSHSACIWDIKNLCCENRHDPSVACVSRGCSGGVSFATCSADGTIRLWDLSLQPDFSEGMVEINSLEPESLGPSRLVSSGIFERDTVETVVSAQGFRSMAVSLDGKYLAAGDCEGNIHIYDLLTSEYTCFKDAHDAEILSLSFSLSSKKDGISGEVTDNHYFLASGGRDRMIHLYDVRRNFDLIASIDDHSAAVTSVKVVGNGCKVLSCSADRSLVFRDVDATGSECKISRRHHQMASHGTVYDMAIDPAMEVAVTVGQDKKINTFEITAGKLLRSFKQDKDFGDPIKVTMDPSCSYLVCCYSNKSICLYDFISGEMITQAVGHGEVTTGVIFLPDCKHIVSAGGDGCIFVWKIPARVASRILQRMKENPGALSPRELAKPVAFSRIIFCGEEVLHVEKANQVKQKADYQGGRPRETSAFKFSISRLPKWAQAKVIRRDTVPRNPDFTSSPEQQVEQKIFSPSEGGDGVHDSECNSVQTPSNHAVKGSNYLSCLSRSSLGTDNCHSSPSPQDNTSSVTMDKRWLTVYNVCLDILNSPEMPTLKDSLQDTTEISGNNECSSGNVAKEQGVTVDKAAASNNIDFPGEDNGQCHLQNISKNHRQFADATEQRNLIKGQEDMDMNSCHTECEVSDLFKQHFGNLSATDKAERRKSSVRRRYSSQYVVRRDYLGGCKRIFDTPVEDLSGKNLNSGEEVALRATLDNPAFELPEERTVVDFCNQDSKNSMCGLTLSDSVSQVEVCKCTFEENSTNAKGMEAGGQKEHIPEGTELPQRITACREALMNLDAAATNAVQLFAKLGSLVSGGESSSGPRVQLSDEADKLLPSITEKVNAIAKMVAMRQQQLMQE